MIELIKQVDYHDRHNKGKKKWAIACEEQQKRETEEQEKKNENHKDNNN